MGSFNERMLLFLKTGLLLCEKDDRNVVMGLIICSKTVTLQLHVQIYLVIKEESKISLKFDWSCDDQQITSHVG